MQPIKQCKPKDERVLRKVTPRPCQLRPSNFLPLSQHGTTSTSNTKVAILPRFPEDIITAILIKNKVPSHIIPNTLNITIQRYGKNPSFIPPQVLHYSSSIHVRISYTNIRKPINNSFPSTPWIIPK